MASRNTLAISFREESLTFYIYFDRGSVHLSRADKLANPAECLVALLVLDLVMVVGVGIGVPNVPIRELRHVEMDVVKVRGLVLVEGLTAGPVGDPITSGLSGAPGVLLIVKAHPALLLAPAGDALKM